MKKSILNINSYIKSQIVFLFSTRRKMDMYFFQASLLIYKKLLRQEGLFFAPKQFEDILPLHEIANSYNSDDQHEQTNARKL